jgi:hypothetical protein
MTKSVSSREQVRYSKELTWAVTDAVAMQNLNITATTLNQLTNTVNSDVIRADTNRFKTLRTGISGAGDVSWELQFGGQDFMIEGALRNVFSSPLGISSSTISFDNSDNSINDSASGLGSVQVGQTVRVSGSVANSGFHKVISVTANKLLTTSVIVTEAAGPTIDIDGQFMINSIVDQSFTIEREFSDISEFYVFPGLRVGSFNFSASTGAIITGSTTFQGERGISQNTTAGTGPALPAVTTCSMNSVDNILQLKEDGVLAAFDVLNLSLTIDTSVRDIPAIGHLPNVNIGTGTIKVSGTMEAYFESATLLQKYLEFQDSGLSFITQDPDGNSYVWEIFKLKFTDGPIDNPGIDNELTQTLSFEAEFDPLTGSTVAVSRIAA